MALEKVEGQIRNLNYQTRTFTVHDINGMETPVRYNAGKDDVMQKQKNWFFTGIVGERADGVMVLDSLTYYKKPDNWPENKKQGSGGGGWKPAGKTPEEIRSIENQVAMKEAAEIYRRIVEKHTPTPDLSYERVGEDIAIVYRILRDAMREEDKKEAPK
jgi:hypothetical protein